MHQARGVAGGITFFYYDDIETATSFYQDVLGFELAEDQGWARIFRMHGGAHVGVVDGSRGFHRPQETSAVLLTVLVNDVDDWYERLTRHGVPILAEIETHREIGVRCFFAQDPGGYALEFQRFLKPETAERFGQATIAQGSD